MPLLLIAQDFPACPIKGEVTLCFSTAFALDDCVSVAGVGVRAVSAILGGQPLTLLEIDYSRSKLLVKPAINLPLIQ